MKLWREDPGLVIFLVGLGLVGAILLLGIACETHQDSQVKSTEYDRGFAAGVLTVTKHIQVVGTNVTVDLKGVLAEALFSTNGPEAAKHISHPLHR